MKEGSLVLMEAMGGGFTWGAVLALVSAAAGPHFRQQFRRLKAWR